MKNIIDLTSILKVGMTVTILEILENTNYPND